MGHEILYCSTCRTQLRGPDFEKGKAHKGEGQVLCRSCYQEAYHVLPPKVEDAPSTSNTPSRGTSSKSRSTRSIPIVAAPPAPEGSSDPSGATAIWVGVGTVGVLLLMLLVFASGGGRSSGPSRTPDPPHEPRVVTISPPPTSVPVHRKDLPERESREVPNSRPPVRREETARESFQKAVDSERRQPTDFEASAALYEQALWDAKETPLYPEVKGRLDALRARQRQTLVEELAPLVQRVRGMCDQEQFGTALEALESAKGLHSADSWKALLEQRLEEVRGRLARAFAPVKEKAVDARKRGRLEEANALAARVSAWGVASITKEMQEAFVAAAAPTPAPEASVAAEGFRSAWAAAMASCTGRDFLEASKSIEAAASALRDKDLRTEAAADAELLRKTAALNAEAVDLLSKLPKGRELGLSYVDSGGARKDVKGQVVRADAFRLAITRDKELSVVDVGEILASSLAEILGRRSGRSAAADAPGLALLCLAEGDVDGARKLAPGTGLPAKYWAWGEGLRATFEAPEAIQTEASARSLFAASDRDVGTYSTQAQGVLKARALLAEFAKTRFVRRNRASIGARGEEARDFVFLAEDLAGAGTFKMTRGRSGLVWTSDSDSDATQRKNNFVDLDFSMLPDLKYRCWAYVGGCCAETLAFAVQGTEMRIVDASAPDGLPAEPGADAAMPVKHSIAASTKTHASHGGKKQPSHWGWVEVPLPASTSAAPRKLRIVSDQQGFSVGAAVVSATRQAPPAQLELRELERARGFHPVAVSPGMVSVSLDKAEGGYDLTRLGTLDWAYWGRGTNLVAFDHKAAGGGQISRAAEIGRGAHSGTFATDSRTVAWSDGAPTQSSGGEHGCIWSNGALNTGFSFSCSAGTTARTLLLYCGASTAAGTLTAALSDSSAPPAVVTYDGPATFLATITFKAGSPNQVLRVSLLKTGNHPGFTDGSVDLIAAMLR